MLGANPAARGRPPREVAFDGFAARVRRVHAGLTLAQVAQRVGVGVDAVSRWERGIHRPTKDQRAKLARILRCRVVDLKKPVELRPAPDPPAND